MTRRPEAIRVPAPTTPRPRPPEDPRAYAQALAVALSQDARDGVALRRLREAIAPAEKLAEHRITIQTGPGGFVWVSCGPWHDPHHIEHCAASIAVAADRCRQELER